MKHLSNNFEWAALHYEHNYNFKWDCKMLFGADGIHETNIQLHDGNVMFQSHIFGDWNKNVWNDSNYDQLNYSLEYLVNNHDVSFKTLSEI